MIGYTLRRLIAFVPALWVVATLTFFMVRIAPGGPFQAERDIPPAARAALAAKYGLDQPPAQQYLAFLGNAARLDFGPSYRFAGREVRGIILEGFRVSAELGGWALLVALLAGVPLGVLAALRKGTAADAAVMGVALAGVSIPNFVLGPLLVLAFALGLYWLPPALWESPASRVLPVLTLAAAYVAYVARLTRAGMLDVLRQDFVRTARAKGLSERLVVLKHALRLGLLPVVSYLGPAAAAIVMGSLVVEQVFAVPGLGRYLVQGAFNRDYTLVTGTVLFYAAFLMTFNLLADLVHAWLDPRQELS